MGRRNSDLRQIALMYWNRHILTGNVSNVCTDTRCESGEKGLPQVFKIGDWVYSHGNNHTRRLFCPQCAFHQNLISEAERDRALQKVILSTPEVMA